MSRRRGFHKPAPFALAGWKKLISVVDEWWCYRYNINVMSIGSKPVSSPWLLLIFSLPAKSASQRVDVWRKLQRYGMLALRSAN
jgi:hypothetical protein